MYVTTLLSFFISGYCNPTVDGILKISFFLILGVFLYRKSTKTMEKDIFKIRPTVGFRYQQLKNDNGSVNYVSSKFKNTEQGLHQLCGSFFSLVSKNIVARMYHI